MSFLEQIEIDQLKKKLVSDLSILGKLYKAKKREDLLLSVTHTMVDHYQKEGWSTHKTLKTKTILSKQKTFSRKFEDDIWCQLYRLGYRTLNYDETFLLPFGKRPKNKKQIDVVAINDDTVVLVECKSSEKPKRAPSYKDEFDLLGIRLDGFRKTISQAFGDHLKVKYIFATRNLRIESDSVDIQKLVATNSFYYNDNAYNYVNNIIKNYKNAAHYQFLGLVFKNQLISSDRIEIPAIEGDMGNRRYYMFSIEPHLLLKLGFILHKTRTIEEEIPNYQRLLVPSRMNSITKFIDEGGFFPNSIIVSFSQTKHRLQFEASSKGKDSRSRYGTLKIPNAYSIAYIIDGQHRLYGYANSVYRDTNTIPVVAFQDLLPKEQLEIFMDINQNQKAVSPSLRLMLEEDLFWDSPRTDSRLMALRSGIIRELCESQTSPLLNKIEIGADPAPLSAKFFEKGLKDSHLLPKARGNRYLDDSLVGAIYNTNNQDHDAEMLKSKKKIVQLVSLCYEFMEENYNRTYEREKYFILSNRGSYAFIALIGSLNKHLTIKGVLTIESTPAKRFEAMGKYLVCLLDHILNIPEDEESRLLSMLGATADVKWLRNFQFIIHQKFADFNPPELIDWIERQDKQLQEEGRNYGIAIERHIKLIVLRNLRLLFKQDWELEINKIKRECVSRAEAEMERNYREGLPKKVIPWTDMLSVTDYKFIINKYWTNTPPDDSQDSEVFKSFMEEFSIDIGEGFKSDAERLKWISRFRSYRNTWAHEGSKEKGLNKNEVEFLKMIHNNFYGE